MDRTPSSVTGGGCFHLEGFSWFLMVKSITDDYGPDPKVASKLGVTLQGKMGSLDLQAISNSR